MNKVQSHDNRRARPASMYSLEWQKVKLDLYVRSQTITDRIQAVLLGKPTATTMTKEDGLNMGKKELRRWSWSPWYGQRTSTVESMDEIQQDSCSTRTTSSLTPPTRTIYEQRKAAERLLNVPLRRSSLPPCKKEGEDDLLRCLSLAHVYLDVVVPYDNEKRYYEEDSDDEGSASDDEYESSDDEDSTEDHAALQAELQRQIAFSPAPCPRSLYENPACASSFILPIHGTVQDEEVAVYRKGETDVRIDEATIERWAAEDRCRSCWSDDSDCE